jgi:hypothetical protein
MEMKLSARKVGVNERGKKWMKGQTKREEEERRLSKKKRRRRRRKDTEKGGPPLCVWCPFFFFFCRLPTVCDVDGNRHRAVKPQGDFSGCVFNRSRLTESTFFLFFFLLFNSIGKRKEKRRN